MKKLLALLLCLSLSIFTVARAMKPGHALAAVAKIDQEKPTGQKPAPRPCSMTQTRRWLQ